MVEFGLKLEDNKVDEWSDKYIDYEALKKILKKASSAIKKRDELIKRKPDLAAEIIAAYREGKGNQFKSPYSSQNGLNLLDISTPIQEETEEDAGGTQIVDQVPTEEHPLLRRSGDKSGSQDTMAKESEGDRQSDSISSTIQRAVSGVSGYFSSSKYEHRIREALNEIETQETRFGESLNHEVSARLRGNASLVEIRTCLNLLVVFAVVQGE